jgi:hypothetical protein
VHRCLVALAALLVFTGCGGGSSSSSSNNNGGGSNPPQPATPVTVVTGQTTTGADITVPAPALTAQENAQDLGVTTNVGCSGASAFNVGDVIHRGSTMQILVFGAGLSSTMDIKVSGPADIQLSNAASVKAKDGTPGVCLTAAVANNAALGARTMVFQATNGDITTFTGGLEVLP